MSEPAPHLTLRERNNVASQKVAAAKKRFVADYKAQEGCRDCGEDDPVVLDLHHRDPEEKDPSLGGRSGQSIYSMGWKRLRAEVEKCDVLCANCHRRQHYLDTRSLR